jgi:hypothetical protein
MRKVLGTICLVLVLLSVPTSATEKRGVNHDDDDPFCIHDPQCPWPCLPWFCSVG